VTSIYYEHFPVARLADQDGLSLAYDAAWEQRASAFPLSLTMPLRVGSRGPEQVMPWLANLLLETHLSEIGQQLKVSPQDILVDKAVPHVRKIKSFLARHSLLDLPEHGTRQRGKRIGHFPGFLMRTGRDPAPPPMRFGNLIWKR